MQGVLITDLAKRKTLPRVLFTAYCNYKGLYANEFGMKVATKL
jgi:hypothetical protein